MNKQKLENLIKDFSEENLEDFLFEANFDKKEKQDLSYLNKEDIFSDVQKLGEIQTDDKKKVIVATIKVNYDLSETSSRKKQYDLGKRILDNHSGCVAGIFVFYDNQGSFRFSLIYNIYSGTKRILNSFKRYTYFVSKEFTNKTFLQRIGDGDFSTLEKIKEAFSVEKVTKEFYRDIANWYFWAVSHCQFPKDAEKAPDGKDNISVIRLITRIIFIWFMRERGLINKDLFEKQQIQDILKNLNNDESSYYKAILQNLFFATLSTKHKERKFGSEKRFNKGWNEDYDNQYVFRYHELFKNSEGLKKYFGGIPFLNGGLFECLDDKRNNIIIDGFSRTKKNQPIVPNFLFFSDEKNVDLSKEYGTKSKKHKVRGLIDTLSSYNFTIDENSPDDADIALDPELLGRVFENLLASFNPETSTTARKATGSYYTPREIVDYMVVESLKAYFKTHLSDVERIDEKLEQLFSNEPSENPFDKNQSKKLVELIESVKIVDPAVGSGAFPMGVLNKLVFILNKVDPGNKLWKEVQLKAVDTIPDPSARRMVKERIEYFFEGKNADYGRKLYLIQRCIYGVDIQQIAVEIAKLRFFISLLVDEKIDETKPNWDIQPLPNLDFKIMRGNSLESVQTEDLFGSHNKKKLEELKEQFFFEPDHDKKREIKREIDRLFNELTDNKRLFDFELYFSEVFNKNGSQNVGFDIVLANPPYIGEKGHKKLFQEVKNYKLGRFYLGKMDYFYFFFHIALDIGKKGAQIAFITTNYYLTAMGARKLRQDFKERGIIRRLVNFNELKIFEAAIGQHNMITIFSKMQDDQIKAQTCITKRTGTANEKILNSIINGSDINTDYYKMSQKELYSGDNIKLTSGGLDDILDEIAKNIRLKKIANVNAGIQTSADKFTNKHHKNYPQILAKKGEGIFIFPLGQLKKIVKDEGLIKPWFKNSDITKWITNNTNKSELLLSNFIANKKQEPDVIEHLIRFKEILINRSQPEHMLDWWDLHQVRMKDKNKTGEIKKMIFDGPKIVTKSLQRYNNFAYNDIPWYAPSGAMGGIFYITIKEDLNISPKYLLGILNSKLIYIWLYNRGKRKGEMLALSGTPLLEIPIKKISPEQQKPFINLVDQILEKKKDNPQVDTGELEREIDGRVYELYNLTEEERKIIENN